MSKKVLQISISLFKNLLLMGVAYLILSAAVNFFRAPALQTLPAITATSLTGEKLDLYAELNKEKPVLIYIWGSWCPVCKTTSPTVNKFSKQSDLAVFSIASHSGDDPELASFMIHKDYNAMIARTINDSDGSLMQTLDAEVTPTIILAKQQNNSLKTQALTGYRSALELRFRLWLLS